MALLRSSLLLSSIFIIMATYEVKLTFKTMSNPREVLDLITAKVRESIPILSISHHLVEERPTTDEHHGGIQDE